MAQLLQDNRLPEPEARKYFRQLISAIDHSHRANVVHRDLKLENMLLDENKNLLVTDFGLGRSFDPESNQFMSTFCGTPNYASVEMVSGVPYVGVKSDIWSMGVILYYLLSGEYPFKGQNTSMLYKNIKEVKYCMPENISEGNSMLK